MILCHRKCIYPAGRRFLYLCIPHAVEQALSNGTVEAMIARYFLIPFWQHSINVYRYMYQYTPVREHASIAACHKVHSNYIHCSDSYGFCHRVHLIDACLLRDTRHEDNPIAFAVGCFVAVCCNLHYKRSKLNYQTHSKHFHRMQQSQCKSVYHCSKQYSPRPTLEPFPALNNVF